MAKLLEEARHLANYIESLNYKDFIFAAPQPYNHIGALFTDIILQSGLNYSTVVRPRVARVFRLFPEANTVSKFELVISEYGIKYVINWKSDIKTERILSIIQYSKMEFIESESDLKSHLLTEKNRNKLLSLHGIGPKTIDYTLKLLCIDAVAVDRHIFNFILNAGINNQDYFEVKTIVEYAADLLQSSRIKLDSFIWQKMSNDKTTQTFLFC